MKPFEIYIAYISWKKGGKRRPVLVFEQFAQVFSLYAITSQFENKSEAIRAKYFKINDWRKAGLLKQSYVDTNRKLELPLSVIDEREPIGALTDDDKQRLTEFLLQ
jgi:hypothetical protein